MFLKLNYNMKPDYLEVAAQILPSHSREAKNNCGHSSLFSQELELFVHVLHTFKECHFTSNSDIQNVYVEICQKTFYP